MPDWVQLYDDFCATTLGLQARSVHPSAGLPDALELVEGAPQGQSQGVGFYDEDGELVAVVEVVESPVAVWVGRLAWSASAGPEQTARMLVQVLQQAGGTLAGRPLCLGRSPRSDWDSLGFEPLADGAWRFVAGTTPTYFDAEGTFATGATGWSEEASATSATIATSALPDEDTLEDDLSPKVAPLAVGMAVGAGRFQIDAFLGRGAMGEVWSAEDRRLGSAVALKVMRAEHVDREAYVARFEQEVRVTAQLDHPAVVSVADAGTLADGRQWFAMDKVRGDDLLQVMRRARPASAEDDPSAFAGWVRRMANILLVVAQAVASAHERGVVHRDIKPSNIMLGPFGQVLLMDWGVARNVGENDAYHDVVREPVDLTVSASDLTTRMGQRVGTPAYMAPEQARGEADKVGPPADVFALGVTLFEALTGVLPLRRGPEVAMDRAASTLALVGVPAPLADIVVGALAARRTLRPDATALSGQLRDFLDGTARRERADKVYQEAVAAGPEAKRLQAHAQALFDRAAAMLAVVPTVGSPDQRKPAWRVEAQAQEALRQAVAAELGVEQQLRSALELWDGHLDARDALVRLYMDRVLQGERTRDLRAAHAAEEMLRRLNDPSTAAFLRAEGAVTLLTDPPGARVTALRLGEEERRLVPVERRDLGNTPLREVPLVRGSWMLEVEAPGRQLVRYPVFIERGEHWRGVAPGDTEPTVIHLPPEGLLSEDEVYVPAGWFIAGGDPQACESVTRRRIWVDAMVVRKHLLTLDEWWEWRTGDPEGVHPETVDGWGNRYLDRPTVVAQDGLFVTDEMLGDKRQPGSHPAFSIGAVNAIRLARWWADRPDSRWAWQVPTEWMWEKAARGVDGRAFPWGDQFDPGYCNSGQVDGKPASRPVGSQPLDVGPFGLLGTAGQVREGTATLHSKQGHVADGERAPMSATVTTDPTAWYICRGGSHFSNPVFCRLAGRFVTRPLTASTSTGLRLFAPYRRPDASDPAED